MAKPQNSTRIGEAERAAAQRALQEHLNAGRLQVTEYADRSGGAANAMTASEIKALFADLPAPHPKLPRSPLGGGHLTLAVVGAVAVLALVGILAFVIGRGGQNEPASSSETVAVPTPSAAPAPDSATSPTTSPGTPSERVDGPEVPLPGSATVRRTTGREAITLRPSYGIDLDDVTSPNWSVGVGCCGRDVGFGSSAGQLYIENDYAVMSGTPGYATCAQETGYTNGPLERGSLQPGENICVRTNGSRYALVTIVSASDQAVQFRAVVWDPQYS